MDNRANAKYVAAALSTSGNRQSIPQQSITFSQGISRVHSTLVMNRTGVRYVRDVRSTRGGEVGGRWEMYEDQTRNWNVRRRTRGYRNFNVWKKDSRHLGYVIKNPKNTSSVQQIKISRILDSSKEEDKFIKFIHSVIIFISSITFIILSPNIIRT